jgi:tetratricopeptide (TPR) repeat protein
MVCAAAVLAARGTAGSQARPPGPAAKPPAGAGAAANPASGVAGAAAKPGAGVAGAAAKPGAVAGAVAKPAAGAAAGAGAAAKPAGRPSGAKPPAGPKPAGSSAIESTDVPAWTPPPRRFAVAPFENRANVHVFDWLIAGAPFEISEKTEAVFGLEPTGGPLHVGAAVIEAEADPVAAFAAAHDAAFVITGWVERPNWQLRIDLALWKVSGGTAAIAAEAQRTGDVKAYHQLLGEALADVWTKGAGLAVDEGRARALQRPLAIDLYAVNLMGRGLGHMTGALAAANAAASGAGSSGSSGAGGSGSGAGDGVDLKSAEHDLERAVFIDPRCFEAQRLLGELYLALSATPPGDARLAARALGKFNYANDLAPDDIASLRAAAAGAAQAGKHEPALELFRRLVTRRPWDLDARYQLGAAMWRTGDPAGAQKQLEQVTAHRPDHLQARRVLALIHASRSDTPRLIAELEAIAARAPDDLEVKADLASAYGALGRWDKAIAALETIARVRPGDLALEIRIGDAYRRRNDLGGALAWYTRAIKLAPESSWPGFTAAQALFDAGRLADANHAYTSLQRYRDDLPAAEQALGVIALLQNRPDDAAWYLRRAARDAPRNPATWRALIAAELGRKDAVTAARDAAAALPTWPEDAELRYLAGVAYAMQGERAQARHELVAAAAADPALAAPRAALAALDAGTAVALQFTPELVRPWGDAEALGRALDRYARISQAIADTRATYQRELLGLLGLLNRGPYAPARPEPVRRCPVTQIAGTWAAAQHQLDAIVRLGAELEATWRFIARHDDAGATAGLLPNARTQVAAARRSYKLALADLGELRAEWSRGLQPELRAVGCSDRLLAAAVADPSRYRVVEDDRPEAIPTTQPPRPRARARFYVDNSHCLDPVEVWIDGTQVGQVAAGRRSALLADGGERTLCLLVPGAAQCGDRGTVREVYLHDGWAVTMHCLK